MRSFIFLLSLVAATAVTFASSIAIARSEALAGQIAQIFAAPDGSRIVLIRTQDSRFPLHLYWGTGSDLYQIPIKYTAPTIREDSLSWTANFNDARSGKEQRLALHENKIYFLADRPNEGGSLGQTRQYVPGVWSGFGGDPGRLPLNQAQQVFSRANQQTIAATIGAVQRGQIRLHQLPRMSQIAELNAYRPAIGKFEDGRIFVITRPQFNFRIFDVLYFKSGGGYEAFIGQPGHLSKVKIKSYSVTEQGEDGLTSLNVFLEESDVTLISIKTKNNFIGDDGIGSYFLAGDDFNARPIVKGSNSIELSARDRRVAGLTSREKVANNLRFWSRRCNEILDPKD